VAFDKQRFIRHDKALLLEHYPTEWSPVGLKCSLK
jgi:hypothetical protein